jgi:hypothetical protein
MRALVRELRIVILLLPPYEKNLGCPQPLVKVAFERMRAWGMPRVYLSSVLSFVVCPSSAVC